MEHISGKRAAVEWGNLNIMSQLEMPLYQQIYDEIKHAIDNGIYVPGDKIPTEAELSTKYAVSRITVRRAIDDLGAAGFLVKRRGLGTFVCEPRMRRKLLQGGLPQSFSEICRKSGRVPGAKLINREIVVARQDEREFFGLDEDDLVLHVQRLRTADEQPIFEENMCLPYVENKELARCDLQGNSLYELLDEFSWKASRCRTRRFWSKPWARRVSARAVYRCTVSRAAAVHHDICPRSR